MHRFSWRMATVQMRLMLHREEIGRSECAYHHGLFIQPNTALLTCLQRLCDHTFCLPMMHLPFYFVRVCPSNACCAFTFYTSQSCHLCVYIQRVYAVCVSPCNLTRAASPHLKLQPCSYNGPPSSLLKEKSGRIVLVNKSHVRS